MLYFEINDAFFKSLEFVVCLFFTQNMHMLQLSLTRVSHSISASFCGVGLTVAVSSMV